MVLNGIWDMKNRGVRASPRARRRCPLRVLTACYTRLSPWQKLWKDIKMNYAEED